MLGILKDEDEFYVELNLFKPKWRIRVPYSCRTYGEFGIGFRNSNMTIYWGHCGYHSFNDFIKELKRKRKGND